MPDSFGDVWRIVHLHLPDADPLLVQDWVRQAYREFCGTNAWSFLRKESALRFLDARALTATPTQYSTTVTSAALFLPADEGRQIRASGRPIYTILAY